MFRSLKTGVAFADYEHTLVLELVLIEGDFRVVFRQLDSRDLRDVGPRNAGRDPAGVD